VPVVDPAETVMDAGTDAARILLLDRQTLAPPMGAGELKVTVPVAEFPATIVDGLSVRCVSVWAWAGLMHQTAKRIAAKPGFRRSAALDLRKLAVSLNILVLRRDSDPWKRLV